MRFRLAYREDPVIVADPAVAGNGTSSADWRATLPEAYEVKDDKGAVAKLNLRADPTLARYKSPEEAFRGLIEAQKVIGRGVPAMPGPDAKPEDRRAFYDALGVPKDAAGYGEIKAPDGVDPAGLGAFVQNVALSSGMTVPQVQAAVNFLGEYQARQMKDMVQRWDEGQEALRAEWGYNFDRNHDMSARFLTESFKKAGVSEEFTGMLDKLGLGHHPDFIKWTHMLATNATEDVFVPGAPDQGSTDQARDQQIEVARDAFFKAVPGTKEYAVARERYEGLMKARWGTQEVTGDMAPRQ